MEWPYHYTPEILPLIACLAFLLVLAWNSSRHRSVPGALPFSIACVFTMLWGLGSILELTATTFPSKIVWFKFQQVWIIPAVTAILCFVLEYADPGRWLIRCNLILLSIPPFLSLVLILTNDLHHLMWFSLSLDRFVSPLYASGYWLGLGYVYMISLINMIVFIWLFIHSPQHRWPVALMLAGQITGRLVYLLNFITTKIATPEPIFLVTVFPFTMYALALFRFHIFNPIPAARETVIEQIREGMLVLDIQHKIVDLNPMAEKILGIPGARLRGHVALEVLPANLVESIRQKSHETVQAEISLGDGRDDRDYTLQFSPLKDWHGHAIGRLVLLHDVTEQKRAQFELLEQQRMLATLQEGEHLARELHDQLAQEISFINLQAQAACALLESGQTSQAKAAILRLAEIARQTQTDVRELISFLSNPGVVDGIFLETIRQTVDSFSRKSGIQVELQASDSFQTSLLSSTAEVQLLRITQEALTNIRKHASASHVIVSLAMKSGQVELAIEDDGIGFDPDKLAGNEGNFGLRIMADRAEDIGAAFHITSAPGSGAADLCASPEQLV